MSVFQQALEQSEKKIGATAAAVGSAGLTVQVLTDWMGLVATTLNVILALGGIFLMFHKIRRARNKE